MEDALAAIRDSSEPKRPCAPAAITKADSVGQKKSWLASNPSQLRGFYRLRQLSTDGSDDDGGGGSSGVRCTSSMTVHNSNRMTDRTGSSYADNIPLPRAAH